MSWPIGQKLVCVKRGEWLSQDGEPYPEKPPVYGRIYVSDGPYRFDPDYFFVRGFNMVCCGIRVPFAADCFRPATAIEELVNSLQDEKGSDAPIRPVVKPQTQEA